MTWSARMTVQDVSDGPSPIDVLAAANDTDITSNTEGKITGVEVRLKIDADETAIKAGDEIQVSGHFLG